MVDFNIELQSMPEYQRGWECRLAYDQAPKLSGVAKQAFDAGWQSADDYEQERGR